jgi:hypothetical protein
MKITIIKPKTRITIKMNSNNLIRFRRPPQFNFLHSTFYILSAAVAQEFPLDTYKSFMQNEPNFQCSQSKLNAVIAATYNEKPIVNQKITNPIEPNTNPISKRPNINANSCHNRDLQRKISFAPNNNEPKRTQSQPNSNPKRTRCLPPGSYNKNTPTSREKK